MIPSLPLSSGNVGLDKLGSCRAQPLNLPCPGFVIVEFSDLLSRAISCANDQVCVLVSLVTAWVRFVDSPHHRNVPAACSEFSEFINQLYA